MNYTFYRESFPDEYFINNSSNQVTTQDKEKLNAQKTQQGKQLSYKTIIGIINPENMGPKHHSDSHSTHQIKSKNPLGIICHSVLDFLSGIR